MRLILLLSSLMLISCSFNKEDAINDETKKEATFKQQKLDELSPFVGMYNGTIAGPNVNYNVQISLFISMENQGTNAKGNVIENPVMKASLKWVRPVKETVIFNTVKILNSTISLSKPSDPNSFVNEIILLASGNNYTGSVNDVTGAFLGNIHISLSSKTAAVENPGITNDYNVRLKQELSALTGTYQGTVIPPNPALYAPFNIKVELTVAYPANSSTPYLQASYSSVFTNDLQPTTLNVQYNSDYTFPQLIISNCTREGIAINQGPCISIDSHYNNGIIEGDFNNYKYQGKFLLKR